MTAALDFRLFRAFGCYFGGWLVPVLDLDPLLLKLNLVGYRRPWRCPISGLGRCEGLDSTDPILDCRVFSAIYTLSSLLALVMFV